jgi:MFS transporter, ACS family, aldohexuronate transporter
MPRPLGPATLASLRQDTDRYRWWALAVTTFTQAASAAVTSAIGPIAALLQREFDVSRAQVGLAQTMIYLTGTFAAMGGGRLADTVGERRVLLLSGVLTGLAALCAGLAVSFPLFLLVGLAIGVGTGMQNPAGSAAVMRWFPPRRRGFAMGLRQTGVPLGGVLAATLWPLAAVTWGWRVAYVLAGVMALAGTALIALAYFDPERETAIGAPAMRGMLDLMTDRRLWLLSVMYNGQIVAQYAANVYFVLFLHEWLGLPLLQASWFYAIIHVAAIVARIGWGFASDAYFLGRRRPVLLIVIALTLLSMLLAAALPPGAPAWTGLVLAGLIGISAFSWTGLYGTVTIELAGRASAASAVAWVHVLGGVGSLGGAPLFGFVVDRTGSYRVGWLAAGIAVLVGFVATCWLREDRAR